MMDAPLLADAHALAGAASTAETFCLVLTPSIDDAGWRKAIGLAAAEAGLKIVEDATVRFAEAALDPGVLFLTSDANLLNGDSAVRCAAIIPRPTTAPVILAAKASMPFSQSIQHASLLLAPALALADRFEVVTAEDLDRRPESITLFQRLIIVPPMPTSAPTEHSAGLAALSIYDYPLHRPTGPVPWTDHLFAYDPTGLRNTGKGGEDLDITGKARTLVYGPYLAMPPGRWKATMRFTVDSDAATCIFRFDWGKSLDFSQETLIPRWPGVFEISLEHVWTEIAPCEFRVILMQGAFHGHLTFLGGTVERVLDAASAT